MKKKIFALVLALVMALSLAACGDSNTPAGSGSGSGSGSGEEPVNISGDLVICSSATDLDLEAITEGFTALYPDVNIEIITCSAGEGVARVEAEGDNPTIDVFYSGLNQADGDKYAGIFEPYVSSHDSELPEEYQSNNGFYNYDHLSSVVFCVNTDLEAELGLEINSYADLLNPALNGKVIISDPTSSSAAWNNLSNIFAVYGNDSDEAWAQIEGMLQNGLIVVGSSSACFKSVQQGEYVVGLTYEDGAVNLVKDGADNIRLQYPTEGTSATAFGCALVKNGPNPENAKAMIDFLCSADGQTALAAYQEGTLRYTNANYEVPENAWLTPSSEIKWVDRDVEFLTANKDAILEHWNSLLADVQG